MLGLENVFLSPYKEVRTVRETAAISNIEFSMSGEIFSYTANDCLKIFSTDKALLKNIISVQIDTMKYFQNNTIVHSKDSSLYYLSIHDNKYLRKFEGHTDTIKSLSVDSISDLLMSVGTECINIWDIRMHSPIKSIENSHSIASLSTGNEYALADSCFLRIFDKREDYGPIATKSIPSNNYKKIWYTADSTYICLKASSEYAFLNSTGEVVSFVGVEKENDGDTTNDSSKLLCCSGKYIFAYRISDRKKIGMAETPTTENYSVKCSPIHNQFISTSTDTLKLWGIF